MNIIIYNAINEIVFSKNNVIVDQSYSKELNLSSLAKGVYYLKVKGNKISQVSKILIQ